MICFTCVCLKRRYGIVLTHVGSAGMFYGNGDHVLRR